MTKTKNILELGTDDFYNTIKEGVTLVDFWAPWCGPCRMQTPILEDLARETDEKVKIAKLNVDDFPELAGDFHVRSIPTLILFRDGRPVFQFLGVQSRENLLKAITTFTK